MVKLTFHQFSVKILSNSEHCSLTFKFINLQLTASHTNSIFWFADVTIKVSGNTERTLKTSRCQIGLVVNVKIYMLHCLQKRFSANFAEPWGELASRLASEIAEFFVHQQFGCDHFSFPSLFRIVPNTWEILQRWVGPFCELDKHELAKLKLLKFND